MAVTYACLLGLVRRQEAAWHSQVACLRGARVLCTLRLRIPMLVDAQAGLCLCIRAGRHLAAVVS